MPSKTQETVKTLMIRDRKINEKRHRKQYGNILKAFKQYNTSKTKYELLQ